MKNTITLAIILSTLLSCTVNASNGEPLNSTKIQLDGYWLCSSSDYDFIEAIQQQDCIDPEAMALYDPFALGSHFYITGDRISFFRYPYQYYGTYRYEVIKDSLFLSADFGIAHQFSIQKTKEDKLFLNFLEAVTSTCTVKANAEYEHFTPDLDIIQKLIKDSVSYEPLAGKWWYLRKEIGSNDGSEPTILKFPKGMPDSLFISKELINQDIHHPYVALKLNNRTIKMFLNNPSDDSFTLTPEFKRDEVLFITTIDYSPYGGLDTIYHEVVYH